CRIKNQLPAEYPETGENRRTTFYFQVFGSFRGQNTLLTFFRRSVHLSNRISPSKTDSFSVLFPPWFLVHAPNKRQSPHRGKECLSLSNRSTVRSCRQADRCARSSRQRDNRLQKLFSHCFRRKRRVLVYARGNVEPRNLDSPPCKPRRVPSFSSASAGL